MLDDLITRHGEPYWRLKTRYLILCLIAVFGWTFLGELDQVVTASGVVVPENKVKIIQHLEGGIITDILVRENSFVKKGESLLLLNLATSGINKLELDANMAALITSKISLEAQMSGDLPIFDSPKLANHPALVASESALFKARNQNYLAAVEVLNKKVEQNKLRVDELKAKYSALLATLSIAKEELKISQSLVVDQLTSQLEHYQRMSKVVTLKGELAIIKKSIPAAKAIISEVENRIVEEKMKFIKLAANDLAKVESKIAMLKEEIILADKQKLRTIIRSPIDGVIKNMRYQSIGNVVKSGENIMEIVPLNEELVIEVNLEPSDRGKVFLDQYVLVKLSSYDYFRYGGLDGKVIEIAADTNKTKDGIPFYKLMVRVNNSYLGAAKGDLDISSGMQTEVDIHAGTRKIIWLLIKPILKLKHEAFRRL